MNRKRDTRLQHGTQLGYILSRHDHLAVEQGTELQISIGSSARSMRAKRDAISFSWGIYSESPPKKNRLRAGLPHVAVLCTLCAPGVAVTVTPPSWIDWHGSSSLNPLTGKRQAMVIPWPPMFLLDVARISYAYQ